MLKFSAAALAVLAVITFAQPASAETVLNENNVVKDSNNNVVRVLSNDTCVRTKWVSGDNACAPTHVQTVLTEDERVVYFEFNKATLTPAAQRNLLAVAERLAKAEDVASLKIVGFADRIGTNGYNERLSARRAKAVKDFLVKHGYTKVDVADIRAMGESQPVTNCPKNVSRSAQIACLSPDRRVEVELVYVNSVRVTTNR